MNKKSFLPPIVSVLLVLMLKFPLAAQAPKILSIVPNSGQPGQSLSVTITGENTHFLQGSTQVSLGRGITVFSVQVASSASLTAQLSISLNAPLGSRTLTVETETTTKETVRLEGGFTVVGPALVPVLSAVVPGTGQAGTSFGIIISGQNTHFLQGFGGERRFECQRCVTHVFRWLGPMGA